MVYAATAQIIYRYDSQYICKYYPSLWQPGMNETWTELSHELNIKLVSGSNEKKLLFLYRIYAYIFLSSPTLQSESVAVTVWVRHAATEVI